MPLPLLAALGMGGAGAAGAGTGAGAAGGAGAAAGGGGILGSVMGAGGGGFGAGGGGIEQIMKLLAQLAGQGGGAGTDPPITSTNTPLAGDLRGSAGGATPLSEAPRGSGIPFIFTGGQPFPPNERAQRIQGGGALIGNILTVLADAKRKGLLGGGGPGDSPEQMLGGLRQGTQDQGLGPLLEALGGQRRVL